MREEIETNKRRFLDGLSRADAMAAAEIYLEDATLVTPTGDVIQGRAGIERFWRSGLEVGLQGAELDVEQAAYGDELSTETGRYRFLVQEQGGRTRQECGCFLIADKRTADGSWKRAVDMFTSPTGRSLPSRARHKEETQR
jgi:uncharacterized protein (TIGR02246 family)